MFLLILTGTDRAPSTNARCGMPFRNSGQFANLTWLKQCSHPPPVTTFLPRSLVCFKRNMVKTFAVITKARLTFTWDITASYRPTSGHQPVGINFDRFVRACVVVKQLTDSFRQLDTDRDGWIQISYDQFMHTVLNLP